MARCKMQCAIFSFSIAGTIYIIAGNIIYC